MVTKVQELQGEWPKLRSYVKERWGQLADNALEIRGDDSAQRDDGVRQETGDPHEPIERIVSDVMSRGPWAIEEAPPATDGPATIEPRRSPT